MPEEYRQKKKSEGHENEAEALNFLKTAAASIAEKDECTIFGLMVGTELKKLNPRNKVVAKNKIQNVIFELELDEMDGRTSAGTPLTSSDNSYQQPPSVLSFSGRMDSGNVAEIEDFIMFNLDNSELIQMK